MVKKAGQDNNHYIMRSMTDRRVFVYSSYFPDRRSKKDRRSDSDEQIRKL